MEVNAESKLMLNGEPLILTPVLEAYFECCDCGLVHLVRVEGSQDEASLTAYRDDFRTERTRSRRGEEEFEGERGTTKVWVSTDPEGNLVHAFGRGPEAARYPNLLKVHGEPSIGMIPAEISFVLPREK